MTLPVRRPARRRTVTPLDYSALVRETARQLDPCHTAAPGTLVVLPVVGFGEQSAAVLPDAIALLTDAMVGTGIVVAVVNRPVGQIADSTAEWLRAAARRRPDLPLLVTEVALTQRPRLGELRQLAVDAVELAGGPLPPGTPVLLADDDVVALPSGAYADMAHTLQQASLATGPVLFDAPTLPMCLLPTLWTGDLFRALLVDRQFRRLEADLAAVPSAAAESMVLSCHLGVRRDALAMVDGFHDLNELTELVRDLLVYPVAPGRLPRLRRSRQLDGPGDPVEQLLAQAVRVHSRRALAAYAAADVPTVAQWRACRLRSAQVDPVRTHPPVLAPGPSLETLDRDARRDAIAGVGRHLGLVLDRVQPAPADAEQVLALLGLAPSQVDLEPATAGQPWTVAVRDDTGLLERLIGLQRAELAELPLLRLTRYGPS